MAGSRAVLVTGASSGIGLKIARRLAADNCFVYAGVRNDADAIALEKTDCIQAVRLDVTDRSSIEAAVLTVENGRRGLYGLVNNAGCATLGPIINGNDGEFELVMNVNLFGPYRVTKAFGAMVIEAKGRIAMMGSVSGILAEKNAGAYSMSKHAIEALTDSLAAELEPQGVHVSVIEPGKFKTKLLRNAIVRTDASSFPSDLSDCREPDDVADTVARALLEPKPKRRYLVVSTEDEAQRTIRKQIAQLAELNERHRYTFNRRALVRMLDDALSSRNSLDEASAEP